MFTYLLKQFIYAYFSIYFYPIEFPPSDVNRAVKKAIEVARNNSAMGVKPTVLFFDEANTTGAIGTIKTIMCDRLVEGVPIPDEISLQFIAAVNPYRDELYKNRSSRKTDSQ